MTHAHIFRPLFLIQLILVMAVFVLGESALFPSRVGAADGTPVMGWAWSAGTDRASGDDMPFMGWISFSSDNPEIVGPTSTYGVFKATNGDLSGYAWSSNLGWITFNAADVSGCPSNPCGPKVNPGNGQLSGFARACAAFANKNACSGALDPNSGGWDGWISLSGSNYGVTQGSNGVWTGYAWGSDAIGWISMSGTTDDGEEYAVTTGPASGSRVVVLTADSFEIDSGASTMLHWSAFPGATSCEFIITPPSTSGATSGDVSTGPLTSDKNYQVRCTDGTSAPPVDSLPITVAVRTPEVFINVNPARLASGAQTTVTWSASNAASCEITKNNAHWKSLPSEASFSDSLEDPVGITSQTTYRITCSGVTAAATVNINPSFQEF